MKELFVICVLWTVVLFGLRHAMRPEMAQMIGPRETALVMLAPATAVISPNYAIFAFIMLALLWALPQNREQRLRVYFLGLGLLPPLSILIKAPQPLNQLITMDYNMLLAISCVSGAYALAKKRRWNVREQDLLFALLCLVLVFIDAHGTSFTNLLRTIVQVSLGAWLPYYLASRGTAFVRDPIRLLAPIVFAACALSLVAVFEASRGWLLYSSMESGLSDGSRFNPYLSRRGEFIRTGATFDGPTSLSLFIGVATVLLIALRRHFGRPQQAAALLVLLLIGQLCTFSRSGLFVTTVGWLAILWFERRSSVLAATLFVLPMLYSLVTVAATRSPFVAAAFGFTEHGSGTIDYRSDLASRILDVLRAFPLTGINSDQVEVIMADMVQGQGMVDLVNAHLSIALLSGIPGLLLFMLSSIVALLGMGRLRGERDVEMRAFGGMAFSGLLALHAGLVTTNYLGRNGLLLYLLLGVAAGTKQRIRVGNSGKQFNTKSASVR